ncbi:phosphoserine phosphatase SerB [Spirochaeta dissipatitropha]
MKERNDRIFLLTLFGDDRPGITSRCTVILAEHDVNILDIGQSVIHNTLSLGFLIEIPERANSASVFKELLYAGYELGLHVKYEAVDPGSYSTWVESQGKFRYIISLLGRKLTARQIAAVTSIIYDQGLNIDVISRLSGRIPLDEENSRSKASVEISVRGKAKDLAGMKASFLETASQQGIDIAFQEDSIYRRNRRLVCFDMDSTLIQTEVIVELARRAGVGEQVHAITEAAMRGEIDFSESFKQRIALLQGLDESVLQDIADNLPLTEGVETLLTTMHQLGYKTAILSGGFTYFGEYLQKKLGFHYVYANHLEIADGKLTGNYIGEIVDGQKKAEYLQQIAAEMGITLEQVIAIGDGANDLPMLSLAGLGIAFQAKPLVKENADHAISSIGLDGVLYLLGFRDRELQDSLASKPGKV